MQDINFHFYTLSKLKNKHVQFFLYVYEEKFCTYLLRYFIPSIINVFAFSYIKDKKLDPKCLYVWFKENDVQNFQT